MTFAGSCWVATNQADWMCSVAVYPALLPGEGGAIPWSTGPTAVGDAVFIERLRHRDGQAFAYVYERYKTQIYNYLYRLADSAEIADDLTHDTFVNAYEALPGLRTNSALSSWLYRIATNRFRDFLRRKRLIRWLSISDRQDLSRPYLSPVEKITSQNRNSCKPP